MPARKKPPTAETKPLEQYTHKGKQRANNPPVGLVTPETDKEEGKKTYVYDPHLDPSLQWAGKQEHTSFEVPTVSLHVHEHIDPHTIIEAVRKSAPEGQPVQQSLFVEQQNLPLREAIEFYKHPHNWTNRLIAGDSLLVMNSLIEKEGLAGHVQMVYLDPPYGIRYGSNFQPFVNKREVKDGKDEDLTQEPETLKAFRDTWELGIHSYLTYLRDRLLLARELLHESGSIFVQISNENLHRACCLLDELFGPDNLVEIIAFRKKTMPLGGRLLEGICDYLVWYAKDKDNVKFRRLFQESLIEGDSHWNIAIEPNKEPRKMAAEEIANHSLLPKGTDLGQLISLYPAGSFQTGIYEFEFNGTHYSPPPGRSWKTPIEGMRCLAAAGRLIPYSGGETLRYLLKHSDYPVSPLSNVWVDTSAPTDMHYVVETNIKVVMRCLLMATDPGDIVFDPTCGSGTTALVAEQWGRRWITCDTSRVSVTLARQRLMTALFDYYQLAQPTEGVGSGFKYKTVPHVTLKSIANNEPAGMETLYDQPFVDSGKLRVTGPFTVEAVPAPTVQSLFDAGAETAQSSDAAIARSGETLRQAEWRDELARTGIRSRRGDKLTFSRIEPLAGMRRLHADAEVNGTDGQEAQRAVISFGPAHQPMDRLQVARALEEAAKLFPKPKLLIFAAFQFDPEASRDIEETNWPGVTLLKAQMNADLLTDDLKKKRSSNESFWLIGQPDVQLSRVSDEAKPAAKGKKKNGETSYQVEVLGFDYYNTRTGEIESGGRPNIALWMLDTDYDGRCLFPRQVFFPMAGEKDGWARLAKNLKAEIDEELIEAYRGTTSLPFTAGEHGRIAVKIVDDRGIESIKIIDLE